MCSKQVQEGAILQCSAGSGPMSVLFHQGALGDWVLVFPILRALGKTIAVTASSKACLAASIIEGTVACDIEQPDLTRLHVDGGASEVGKSWRRRLNEAATIVSFISRDDGAWAQNVRCVAPNAHLVFVDPRPPADWATHVCDWHEQQLRTAGVALVYRPVQPRVNPAGPIVIHPGSGGRDKCWPDDRFAQLVSVLRGQGRSVQVLIGEVENETWPRYRLRHWIETHGARVVDALDELRRILAGARCYIGNDSGPTQLAAAMGVSTIVLFGPTRWEQWRPLGPAVTVLAPPMPGPMTWLEVGTVLDALKGRC